MLRLEEKVGKTIPFRSWKMKDLERLLSENTPGDIVKLRLRPGKIYEFVGSQDAGPYPNTTNGRIIVAKEHLPEPPPAFLEDIERRTKTMENINIMEPVLVGILYDTPRLAKSAFFDIDEGKQYSTKPSMWIRLGTRAYHSSTGLCRGVRVDVNCIAGYENLLKNAFEWHNAETGVGDDYWKAAKSGMPFDSDHTERQLYELREGPLYQQTLREVDRKHTQGRQLTERERAKTRKTS